MQGNRLPLVFALTSLGLSGAFLHAAELPKRSAPDVHLIAGALSEDRQPDGNTVLLRGSGWIVVDTGRHKDHAQKIIEFAKASQLDVQAILNTHWHLDHSGGNSYLRDAFPRARVYASDALRGALDGFLKDYREQLLSMLERAPNRPEASEWRDELALLDSAARLAPDEVIEGSVSRSIAGRRLSIHLERNAVTGGDLWIEDPRSKTLIAGDLVTLPVPFFDTACPSRWNVALETIAERPFETLIPGHGSPMSRRQFELYRQSFAELLTCASSNAAQTICIDNWDQSVRGLLQAGEQARIKPMLTYYFDAMLRGPNEARTKYCPSLDKN